MQRSGKIVRIFGIDIRLHYSWWFIFILIAWSLSASYFPQFLPEQPTAVYWSMGIAAALLLFVSVLLHELSHSLVARMHKIKVESITLFFFGGVAGLTKEDMKPSSEFTMAIAGPLFSLLLSALFYGITLLNGSLIISAITTYLYQLNFILAVFNMVPGYPLDGGRAFRAILYAYYKDLRKATKIASTGGRIFGGFLVVIGLLGLFQGAGSGLWLILLGGFLYVIAGMSYEQVVVKEILQKIPVKEIMAVHYTTLPPTMKFRQVIRKYASTCEEIFIVGKGVLDSSAVGSIPPKLQDITTAEQLATPFSQLKSVGPADSAHTAFRLLMQGQQNALPVMSKGMLKGIVTKEVLLHRLQWEMRFS